MSWWRLLEPFFSSLNIFLQILRRRLFRRVVVVLQISQKPWLAWLLARHLCFKLHNLIMVQLEESIPG
jgi:hypothetical protein